MSKKVSKTNPNDFEDFHLSFFINATSDYTNIRLILTPASLDAGEIRNSLNYFHCDRQPSIEREDSGRDLNLC